MTDPQDTELQRYLDGKSDISRAYAELPRERPGAALDERVLAAARSAVAPPRRPAWMVPTALAATLTLALSLSWQQLRAPTTAPNDAAVPAAVVSDAAQPAAVVSEAAQPAAIVSDAATPAAAAASTEREMSRRTMAPAGDDMASAASAPPVAATPQPAPRAPVARAPAPRSVAATPHAERASAAAPPAPAGTAAIQPTAESARDTAAGPDALAEFGAAAEAVPPPQHVEQHEPVGASDEAFAPAPAATSGSADAAARKAGALQAAAAELDAAGPRDDRAFIDADRRRALTSPAAMEQSMSSRVPGPLASAEQARPAGDAAPQDLGLAARASDLDAAEQRERGALSAAAERRTQSARSLAGYRESESRQAGVPDLAPGVRDDPARFLDAILARVEDDDMDDARALLRAFRERYPDYPLPDDFPLPDPRLADPASRSP